MSSSEQALKNFLITNAGVVDKNTFVFVAHWEDSVPWKGDGLPPARVVLHDPARNLWGWLEFANSTFDIGSTITGGIVNESRQGMVVDSSGRVVFLGFGGNNYFEGRIPHTAVIAPNRVRLIGSKYFVAAWGRQVAIRSAPNQWQRLSEQPIQAYKKANLERNDVGFDDIDGFSEQDIYACGGDGDLWHYNGQRWRQLDPPCNWRMERLCCARDGNVYIVGFEGEVLRGRDDTWKAWIQEEQGFTVEQIAWYQNKLYCSTHYTLLELTDEKQWQRVDYQQEEIPTQFGYLDANDDILLIAGPRGASFFDGQRWTNIIGGTTQMEVLRLKLMEQQVENLEGIQEAVSKLVDIVDKK